MCYLATLSSTKHTGTSWLEVFPCLLNVSLSISILEDRLIVAKLPRAISFRIVAVYAPKDQTEHVALSIGCGSS